MFSLQTCTTHLISVRVEKQNLKHRRCRFGRMPTTFRLSWSQLIVTHERFAQASIVLRPYVHLMSIEADVARFMEIDPSAEPLNVRRNPLLFICKSSSTRKLIVVPRWMFDELVDGFDVEERQVVWLFLSARCGSHYGHKYFTVYRTGR